jgi:Tol biopolymer transport system component
MGPTGVLWHDNYALDYRDGVQLAHLDGSLPTQITTSDEASVNVWPDGKQYIVTDWNVYDDYTDITVIDRITNSTVYQTQVNGYLRGATASPNNKSLVKVIHGEDSISPFEEFVLDLSTMNVLYVVSDRDWFAWMPDGRFMLINIDTGNMRIASLDSTEETPVGHLEIPADRTMGNFTISPTGKQFVMVMDRLGTTSPEPDLWIGNIDGSGFEQLTDTKLVANAKWSPDGRYVAYTTDTGSICSFGGCLGSCDQWYTPVDLRKVKGLPNTPGSEVFRVTDRTGYQQVLGCSVLAWTP